MISNNALAQVKSQKSAVIILTASHLKLIAYDAAGIQSKDLAGYTTTDNTIEKIVSGYIATIKHIDCEPAC